MMRVVLLLASAPGAPEGDLSDRLEIYVSLTAQGHIDEIAYAEDPLPWRTQRVTRDGRVYHGELIRIDDAWAIRRSGSEDDPVSPFEPMILRPGEYATMRPPDGGELVFRVVSVDQA